MYKTTEIAHILIKNHVEKNDLVVDATCGNGNDTLFLANLVPNGKVLAYDIQLEAINASKELTKEFNNIEFFHTSFENINVKDCTCVLFNLGYLPNGDKKITTNKDITLKTINNLVDSFDNNPKMIIFIIAYPGHQEGFDESVALDEYIKNLNSKLYLASTFKPTNQKNAPYLITISKKR